MTAPDETEPGGPVGVEIDSDGVARILMRDREGHNALSPDFTAALLNALETVNADPSATVVLLCGTPDYFCTGATRDLLEALHDGRVLPTELGLARRVLELDLPVIASCAGAAMGGGLVLAAACDLVVLAADRRYGFNFMDLGITPGMGSTALAEQVFGPAIAHELLYGGEFKLGYELARCVGVSAVAPSSVVDLRAAGLAQRIADKPRKNLSMLKRTLTIGRRARLEEALTIESLMHETSLRTMNLHGLVDAP
jgi:polyketide biosynthesis enoyl-CoA hydratase PksI